MDKTELAVFGYTQEDLKPFIGGLESQDGFWITYSPDFGSYPPGLMPGIMLLKPESVIIDSQLFCEIVYKVLLTHGVPVVFWEEIYEIYNQQEVDMIVPKALKKLHNKNYQPQDKELPPV